MVKEINYRLSTDKSEHLLGEPVIAYIEIKNSGTEPVSVIDQLDPKFGIVKFYIKSENDRESVFRPFTVVDSIRHTVLLEPGKSISHAAKIFYGGDGWTFKSAGKYQLRSSYEGMAENHKVIESNIVEINIIPPRNEDEKEQVNLIMGEEQGLFLLFESGDHLSDGISSLSNLVRKFPQSNLAGYANSALGKNYSMDFKDFQKGAVRKADIEKSRLHLENAKDKNIGSYFRTQTFLTLADVFKRSNDVASAKRTLDEFLQKTSSDDIRNLESMRKARNILDELG
jgi:hypothetical protein